MWKRYAIRLAVNIASVYVEKWILSLESNDQRRVKRLLHMFLRWLYERQSKYGNVLASAIREAIE